MSTARGELQTPASGVDTTAAAACAPLHSHPFKLRFATRREPGRSHQQPMKPRGLPALVAGKFYSRWEQCGGGGRGASETHAAEGASEATWMHGPRDKHDKPVLSSHEYGWWSPCGGASAAAAWHDRRLRHPIQDSAWLKERAALLHHDRVIKGER